MFAFPLAAFYSLKMCLGVCCCCCWLLFFLKFLSCYFSFFFSLVLLQHSFWCCLYISDCTTFCSRYAHDVASVFRNSFPYTHTLHLWNAFFFFFSFFLLPSHCPNCIYGYPLPNVRIVCEHVKGQCRAYRCHLNTFLFIRSHTLIRSRVFFFCSSFLRWFLAFFHLFPSFFFTFHLFFTSGNECKTESQQLQFPIAKNVEFLNICFMVILLHRWMQQRLVNRWQTMNCCNTHTHCTHRQHTQFWNWSNTHIHTQFRTRYNFFLKEKWYIRSSKEWNKHETTSKRHQIEKYAYLPFLNWPHKPSPVHFHGIHFTAITVRWTMRATGRRLFVTA